MRRRWVAAPAAGLAVAGLFAAAAPITAQGPRITGVVRDEAGRPVTGARVALGNWAGAWTSATGRFDFPVASGTFPLSVTCPSHGTGGLGFAGGPRTVSDSGLTLDLVLPDGDRCLQPLEPAGATELEGVLLPTSGGPHFQLCNEPAYRIALEVPPDILRDLARRMARESDPERSALTLLLRGRLEGPGFFGTDGSAAYQVVVTAVTRARMTSP
ncbi:MAG: carboxypeptidase-like regulatory domain-containing protein, partial [Gemmatimonadales bacterium]